MTTGAPEEVMIVTVVPATFVLSAFEVAVIVTVAGFGTTAGAVYTPPAVIVPIVALPPTIPFTFHTTDVSEVLTTVAVNCCDVPITRLVGGDTEMPMLEICELPICVGTNRRRGIKQSHGREAVRNGSAPHLPR